MKKQRVGLMWHNSSSPNRGVSALTISNIMLLEKALPNCEFVAFGYGTSIGSKKDEVVRLVPFGLSELAKFNFSGLVELRRCDLIVDIGEGDSFSDLYGVKRLLNQFFSKVLAKTLCGKLVLAPQTYGPFDTGLGKVVAKLSMIFATAVFSRDDESADALETATGRFVERFADLAFALPFEKQVMGKKVGLNISGLLYEKSHPRFELALDYTELIHDIIEYFVAAGVEVELISHVSGVASEESDQVACTKLLERYPVLTCADEYVSPCDVKSKISSYSFFIGARMHATIAAMSAGVPVVPIGYSMKFSGVFNRIGYSCVLDAKLHDNESALGFIKHYYGARKDLMRQAQSSSALAAEYLNGYIQRIKELAID